jgi:hypothetical protein
MRTFDDFENIPLKSHEYFSKISKHSSEITCKFLNPPTAEIPFHPPNPKPQSSNPVTKLSSSD